MKNIIRLVGLAIFFLSLLGSSRKGALESYSIIAMRAHLYYQSSGEISKYDLLDGKHHELWNTRIGEGEAREPSGALWLLVEISEPSEEIPGGHLALEVTEGEKCLLSQSLRLDKWVYDGNRLFLPFIIYGTGCETIVISARLLGIPAEKMGNSSLIKTIEFKCGE